MHNLLNSNCNNLQDVDVVVLALHVVGLLDLLQDPNSRPQRQPELLQPFL